MKKPPAYADILAAHDRIRPFVHRTPLFRSSVIDALSGGRVLMKAENFQRSGSFKARGAFNAIMSLGDEVRAVVTHSSGNHAAALAMAARERGLVAHIVMPSTATAPKKAAVAAYGGRIVECEPTLAAREAMALAIMEETGAVMVPPFDDAAVMAGQGTAAIELLQDAAEPLDLLLCPVGGGGLLGGTAIAAATLAPAVAVVGAEPEAADDAARGFHSGQWQPQILPVRTMADGLTTAMSAMTFAVMRSHVADMVTAPEDAIRHAMRLIWERMKIVVEPSSAVPLAAIVCGRLQLEGRTAGMILTGGNVDLDHLPWR